MQIKLCFLMADTRGTLRVHVYVVVQFVPLVQFFLNWYRIY